MNSDFLLLDKKFLDASRLSEKTGEIRFLGFLTEDERQILQKRKVSSKVIFFGGYTSAERTFAALMPHETPDSEVLFPIDPITFTYPAKYPLSHRDFLGSVMALGIKRESIGDILPSEGSCTMFAARELSGYILSQIQTIGRVGVKAEIYLPDSFSPVRAFEEIRKTVAAPRVDAVVASLINLSREKSCELILSGMVTLSGSSEMKITSIVREGDIISVRKKGKFIIDSISNHTKKGRISLLARKYI